MMKRFLVCLVIFCVFLWSDLNAQEPARTSATNIVFLLDISNSMGKDKKMDLLRKSTEELCKVLNSKDRISLLTFGSVVESVYSTSSFRGPDSLLKVLQRVRSTASATNINRGIYDAYEQSDKFKLPRENHVFLITDGEFVLSPFTKKLKEERKDIQLTCVIVGRGPSAEKAVRYITEELKLKVITLINEEADARKLADLVRSEVLFIQ